jgi:uncharacterized protein with ATP-grasp and redox domains
MKTYEPCLKCFQRQAEDACRMSRLDAAQTRKLLRRVRRRIASFPRTKSPVEMAADIHALVRSASKNHDPYAEIKAATNRMCLQLWPLFDNRLTASGDHFETAIKASIAGNVIDFGAFRAVELSSEEISRIHRGIMAEPLAGDNLSDFERLVRGADRILYMADNAGECFFDRPLIQAVGPEKVVYAVRGGPVLNDATVEDARIAGIDRMCRVIDTGDDSPGVLLDRVSTEFRSVFDASDVVVAKGQGNYESFSHLTAKTFVFLAKVKCTVIARDIGYPVGSNVIKIQPPMP